ncbi:MAG: hypothetical protein R3181_11045 [Rubricoccaceae bacterium]|nr:hypothetical protein [Rubricoccaceae bacterium]
MPRAKGVIRIDSDSTHGWQVRVYRHGKTYSKLFSDRRHGGKEEAFQKAVAYRKTLEEEVAALPEAAPRRRLIRSNKNNATGVVGISRTFKRDRRGVKHDVYAVSWNPEPGVARGTSFSIKKYGEDEAFKRACKLRWEKMKEIYGDRYDVPSYLNLYRQKRDVDAAARRGSTRQQPNTVSERVREEEVMQEEMVNEISST